MKKAVILLIFAAVILGLIDGGDCTAAVVIAVLLLPGTFSDKRKKPARNKTVQADHVT